MHLGVLTLVLALLATPPASEAQQAAKFYRISYLALTPGEDTTLMKALLERLHELSYSEGKNLIFEYRSAEGRPERLPQLATELARARPDVADCGIWDPRGAGGEGSNHNHTGLRLLEFARVRMKDVDFGLLRVKPGARRRPKSADQLNL